MLGPLGFDFLVIGMKGLSLGILTTVEEGSLVSPNIAYIPRVTVFFRIENGGL